MELYVSQFNPPHPMSLVTPEHTDPALNALEAQREQLMPAGVPMDSGHYDRVYGQIKDLTAQIKSRRAELRLPEEAQQAGGYAAFLGQ